MPMTLDQMVTEAGRLPSAQQAELLDRLLEMVHGKPDPAVEEAWKLETRRRLAEIESGKAEFVPGDQVMAEMRKIVGR